MAVPPHVVPDAIPSGAQQVPAGWTVSNKQVPPNTHFTQGAGRATYEKPRVTSDRRVTGQEANRYRQYFEKYHKNNPIESRNVGRPAETSFSNPPRTGTDPWSDLSRNTEGTRQRRPVQGQGGSGSSSGSVRPAPGTSGNAPIGNAGSTAFELSESVPLLAQTGNTAVQAVTGGSAVAGAASIAGGLALGAGTSAIINRIKDKGAVLPGTDYVGPGNPINIDAPRSAVDAIAKEHDIGYQDFQNRAESGDLSEQEFVEGIDFLDNKAIHQFAERFKSGGEWQAFLGRWGLWLKNRIERITGPIYPKFPGKTWVVGKIFRRIKNLIGTALTRGRDDTRTNNTT